MATINETREFSAARGVILLLAMLSFALLATGCGGQPQSSSGENPASSEPASTQPEKTTSQPKEARSDNGPEENKGAAASDQGAEARAGNAVAKNGEARAGNAVAGDGEARAGDAVAGNGEARAGKAVAGAGEAKARAGNASRTGKVRLRISGTQGTEFGGTCVVGNEKEDISGQAPERFVYRLKGRELQCEIRLRGPGELEVALIGGGSRAIQTINSGQSAVDLAYSSSGVSVTVR